MQADSLSSEPPGKPQFAKVSSIQGLLDLHKKPLVGRKVMLFPHLTDEESEMRLRGEDLNPGLLILNATVFLVR